MKILTTDKFWKIIKKSQGRFSKAPFRQHERLVRLLTKLSVREIIMFDITFQYYMKMADTWEVQGAARVVRAGHDDEFFVSFRAWLITRGKKLYYKALRSPDTLAKTLKYTDDPEWQGFVHCAREAYHRKTGKKMPDDELFPGRSLKDAELPDHFPKLWKKFIRVDSRIRYVEDANVETAPVEDPDSEPKELPPA